MQNSKKTMYLIERMEIENDYFIERHDRANIIEYWLGNELYGTKAYIIGIEPKDDPGIELNRRLITFAKAKMLKNMID